MKEINLISSRKKEFFGYYQKTKIIKTIVISIDLLVFLVMCCLLLIYISTVNKIKVNENKIKSISDKIILLNENESYFLAIDNRANEIQKLLESNVSLSDLFLTIKPLLVPGFMIDTFEINAKNNSSIVGTCIDKQCLSSLNTKAEEMKKSKSFSSLSIQEVVQKQGGIYEVKILFDK